MTTTNGSAATIGNELGVTVVPQGVPDAGAVVWWHLSGHVDAEAFKAAWLAQGLDEALLPDLPSAAAALRRAVYALKGPSTLVRSLDKSTSRWAIVEENRLVNSATVALGGAPQPLEYEVECVISRNEDDSLTFEPATTFNDTHPLVMQVRGAYEDARGRFDHADIGGWLARVVRKIDAVPLRETGGVYFVPRAYIEILNKMRAALRASSSCNVQTVPAMKNDDAVEAILDAVRREAQEEAQSIEDAVMAGTFGKRGLEARAASAAAAADKVRRYEALLGSNLDDLRKRLDDLQASAAMAALACDAITDAE